MRGRERDEGRGIGGEADGGEEKKGEASVNGGGGGELERSL